MRNLCSWPWSSLHSQRRVPTWILGDKIPPKPLIFLFDGIRFPTKSSGTWEMHRVQRLSIPIGTELVSIRMMLSIHGVLVVLAVIAMAVKQVASGFVIDELCIKSFTQFPSLFFFGQYFIFPISFTYLKLLLSLFVHLLFMSFLLFLPCIGSSI